MSYRASVSPAASPVGAQIRADTDEYRSSYVLFCIFFSESKSDTDNIEHLFFYTVFAPSLHRSGIIRDRPR